MHILRYKLVYNSCICMVQLKKITITHIYGFKLHTLSLSLFLISFGYTHEFTFFLFLFLFIEFFSYDLIILDSSFFTPH